MAHAYTPGLKVSESFEVHKERLLPLAGVVEVVVGDVVTADQSVATAALPGDVVPVNVANKLGVSPPEIPDCMLKTEGDAVIEGEVIARNKGLFGLFKSECKAPMTGTLGNVSKVTGQVMIQGPPVPVEVKAYIDGTVVKVIPGEGAVVQTPATFVQGIFGIGGETHGQLLLVVESQDQELTVDLIPEDAQGKVLVGGSLIRIAALKRARECGATAVVVGGFHDADLKELLGKDLGVAITGNEDLGITLIVTEGFGEIHMAERTFELLKSKNGLEASVNGATQIRAGVMRPEIIIPMKALTAVSETEAGAGLATGDVVRIIRQPHFGELGTVIALPSPLQELDSESMARVLELEIPGKGRFVVARSNVEAIER